MTRGSGGMAVEGEQDSADVQEVPVRSSPEEVLKDCMAFPAVPATLGPFT